MEATQLSETQPTQQSPLTQTQNKPQSNPNQICQLLCTTGQYANKTLNLTDKPEENGRIVWFFGRAGDSDLQLTSSSRLSNRHFIIWFNLKDNSLWLRDTSTNGTYRNGQRAVKGSNYLLSQGDEISVGNGVPKDVVKFIVVFSDRFNPSLAPDTDIQDEGIHKDYVIKTETIGQGAFATVKKCIERSTGNQYAVKIINRRKALSSTGGASALSGAERELSILRKLHHPNIVSLKGFYEDADNYYIIMELVPGGDLMGFVEEFGPVGEEATRVITRQILEGINYVHQLGISHRDLKPDNILIMQDEPILVKITDFGLAKFSDNSTVMKTFCGTLAYLAPEVITGKYGSSQASQANSNYSSLVDIWSLGCLVYVLLTALVPFPGNSHQKMFARIKKGEYQKTPLDSNQITKECQDFLRCCLQVDPERRMTAAEALKHEWLAGDDPSQSSQKPLSLSQSQSQQSRKVENSQFDSLSRIDEDFMLRPLDSEKNRKTSKQKQNDFKVPKRVVPLPQSQVPVSQPRPMSQPLKRPHPIDTVHGSTKRIRLEPSPEHKHNGNDNGIDANVSIKEEDLMDEEDGATNLLSLEPIPGSIYSDPISISNDRFAIGRADVCNIAINDDRLSKIHCIFKTDNRSIWLLDMSTNSCKVNRTAIGKGMKRQLMDGDTVYLFDDQDNREFIAFTVSMSMSMSMSPVDGDGVSSSEIRVLEQSMDDLKLKNSLLERM
ncbi:RAD53 [Candida theae]|uniref:Serine/threonine-protein kinase RAD53 n=1 Tax=Candida theae TaxID=1198502 RepID=A0AAD5BJQ8_9ASCO|nr:RAD53 [Candida theae]KAI5968494.1 RAD53 [Candida theae]